MTHRGGYIVLSVLYLFLACAPHLGAQSDFGMGTSPFDPSPEQKKQKLPRPPDVYVRKIARYFNAKEEEVDRLWNKGYGRNELIKLLLIMRGSRQKLRDLARMRDKNENWSKIAAKYNLDYDALLTEAIEVRRTIDRDIADGVPKAPLQASSGTAASAGTSAEISTSTERNHE